jgi:hypothetical protein
MSRAPVPREDERADSERLDSRSSDTAREVARGRNPWTPFILLGSVALTIWLVAGVITAIVILIWIFL